MCHVFTSFETHLLVPGMFFCAPLCPQILKFPWRQVRPSASNEDMKRWTTALHSLHLRTLTMTSPAVTVLTAVTASTLPLALHLPVRISLKEVERN